jgi:hypothetical protein
VVNTRLVSSTAAQNDADGQDRDDNLPPGSTRAELHPRTPASGFVDVSTLPDSSVATHRRVVGHATLVKPAVWEDAGESMRYGCCHLSRLKELADAEPQGARATNQQTSPQIVQRRRADRALTSLPNHIASSGRFR